MERAGRVIRQLKLSKVNVTSEELAKAAWPAAVGKKIASRTRAAGMVRSTLIVEVEDFLWQKNLFGLRRQILHNIEKVLGPGLVEEIEFRSRALPKRMAQREEVSAFPPRDEDTSNEPSDPVFRRIYRQSRRKAVS
jgi:predicted nucleic acid-binding Zn ribbon protein